MNSYALQALVHHLVGRQWRRKLEAAYPEEVAQMLHWFGDQASEQRPFSIHNMCSTGQPYGCVPPGQLPLAALSHPFSPAANSASQQDHDIKRFCREDFMGGGLELLSWSDSEVWCTFLCILSMLQR